jgi:hypothetical protein
MSKLDEFKKARQEVINGQKTVKQIEKETKTNYIDIVAYINHSS